METKATHQPRLRSRDAQALYGAAKRLTREKAAPDRVVFLLELADVSEQTYAGRVVPR